MKRTLDPKNARLAAFDLDGTLLDDSIMSPLSHEAIKILGDRGVCTVIASGRDICQITEEVSDRFSYIITTSGAMVFDGNRRMLEKNDLPREDLVPALRTIEKYGGKSVVYCGGSMILTPGFLLRLIRRTGYAKKSHRSRSKGWHPRFALRLSAFIRRTKRSGFLKIQTFFKDNATCCRVAEILRATGKYEAVVMEGFSLETTASGVTKAKAIERLCNRLGFSCDETICFGDSANDIGMFDVCGYRVAMGNGEACVKERSDYITDSVSEDGVFKAVNRLFRIENNN